MSTNRTQDRAKFGTKADGQHRFGCLLACALLAGSLLTVDAEVPQLLNYQGRVQVGTTDFNGTGQFKFALVNADGTTTYWSNDGTAAGQPGTAVTLPVSKGLYSVLLGNTSLPNMQAVPPTAFANGDVHLRVWFNDGLNGFQQFVPDQRIAAAAYAVNAVTAGSLTGPISVDQLPPGVPRATNGTTTITGNVVVQGTLTAAGVAPTGTAGSSGLPAGTTMEVLINNVIVPGVRFEGIYYQRSGPNAFRTNWSFMLSRPMTDLSWPDIFEVPANGPFTNPPVSLQLSLPNGGRIVWTLPGGKHPFADIPSYVANFARTIGRDGRPYDRVQLLLSDPLLTRSNFNVSAVGNPPTPLVEGPSSGQPALSSMRLIVNNVNYNYVVLQNVLDHKMYKPMEVVLNPSYHQSLSALPFGPNNVPLSIELMLLNGIFGNVSLVHLEPGGGHAGPFVLLYELRLATDGLPYELIVFGQSL